MTDPASSPALIAIDWGTTRFRAYLLDSAGAVIERVASDDGIMAVKPGGFPAVLAIRCGMWMARHPDIPVILAGMVGSRNGWVEAPYRHCPATVSEIAGAMASVDIGNGRQARIVPGLSTRDSSGTPDVMRGEETLALGAGIENGTIILPGTHSKWVQMEKGDIKSFATFMTGEFYATLLSQTILGKLREEPDEASGFAIGLEAARRPGGLTHQAFAARTSVLLGDMSGHEVTPFLSGLLIGSEVDAGLAMDQSGGDVVLIADGVIVEAYTKALAARGKTCRTVSTESCFTAGLARLLTV
jgi:2-dehydro-3-deoxygalactonokinase